MSKISKISKIQKFQNQKFQKNQKNIIHPKPKATIGAQGLKPFSLVYKSELYPIEIDSKSKLSRIIGQRFSKKEKGKKKRHINEVLVQKKSSNAEWVPLKKFISE